MLRCIRVIGHGFTAYLTYDEWVKVEIQDDEEALGIAKKLLEDPDKSYAVNEDNPVYYRTYEVIEVKALREAVIQHDEWINKEIR